ncbi:MAG: hypothetical protein ACK4MV_18860 [Beijerinckiaceae bacterium]
MEFFDRLPTPVLWAGLAFIVTALAFYAKFLGQVIRTGQVSLGGRVLSDAKKDQLVFTAYVANIVIAGGVALAALLALLVELFLVRG